MRIVIDYQGYQSPSNGKRGIGRYTSGLTREVVRLAHQHEFIIVLNGLLSESVASVKAEFSELLPADAIRVWYPPTQKPSTSKAARGARELLFEAYLASLKPDLVWVTSLFEGPFDNTVTSISASRRLPTAVTLFDLIPLLNAEQYLGDPRIKDWYMEKIEALKRADLWFAISESSRQEGVRHLGLSPQRCVNVSTAADPHFKTTKPSVDRVEQLRAKYTLAKPFVMYTGGVNPRKNMDGLIRAFGLLPKTLRKSHQLAVVCSVSDSERQAMLDVARQSGLPADALVVTGFVPEEDLVDLYGMCTLFVFPSLHEGFGLPVLEAMHCGAPVIAADNSSLPEVVGNPEALFRSGDDAAMAQKMAQALESEPMRAQLSKHGAKQAANFSWEISARRVLQAMESAMLVQSVVQETTAAKMRLAYVSPLPPQRSGISTYSAELLPFLLRHYDIELVTDAEETSLTGLFPVRSVEWFRQHADSYDRVVYQVGNSHFHAHMFDLLEEIPGTVVLHDFYLSGVVAYREFQQRKPYAWACALYSSHGYPALARRFGDSDISGTIYEFPCSFEMLALAQGVIVHSPHSVNLARQWFAPEIAKKMAVVPHLRTPPEDANRKRAEAREALRLQQDDLLICAFGILAQTKLNHRLVDAWLASSLSRDSKCQLVFVGQCDEDSAYGRALIRSMSSANLGKPIRVTGWADDSTYARYLAAADIAVQLRTLSRGETSGAVLDAMASGIPTIVNANGSMAFLPEDAVMLLPDQFDDAQLVDALESLRADRKLRETMGAKGRHQIVTAHSGEHCAAGYKAAIEQFSACAADSALGIADRAGPHVPDLSQEELLEFAKSAAAALPGPRAQPQLLIELPSEDEGPDAGYRRLFETTLATWLREPIPGRRLEPVCTGLTSGEFQYAASFALQRIGAPPDALPDALIDARPGDALLVPLRPDTISPRRIEQIERLRDLGVAIHVILPRLEDEDVARFSSWRDGLQRLVNATHKFACFDKADAERFSRISRQSPADVIADADSCSWLLDWVHSAVR